MNFDVSKVSNHLLSPASQVFSKLKEGRFPGEIELKDLVAKKLANSKMVDGVGDLWP